MPWVDFAICFLTGYLGVHKFMDGKSGMGMLYCVLRAYAG